MQIQVTFEIGTNVDDAAINVNNRVKQVEPRLPQEVRRQGVTVERGSSSFLQVLAFYSPDGRYDDLFIVELRDAERARRAEAPAGHDQRADLRRQGLRDADLAQARPPRAAQADARRRRRARSTSRTRSSRRARSARRRSATGQDLVYTITTRAASPTPKEFGRSSCARTRTARRCGCPTSRASSSARRTTTSSAATTARRRRWSASSCRRAPTRSRSRRRSSSDDRPSSRQRFPEGLTYAIPYDTTRFVEVSIREVLITLGEAMLLVFLVVYLFLQSWRAAIIPFARGAGVADRHVRRPATCSATRSTR